jgi:predicted dehydrogenase
MTNAGKFPSTMKVRWGVLGAAKIATTKVIPAMRHCLSSEVAAIASRDLEKARRAADALGIPRAYGSYEELLADPDIEAIYNPLPNHLHVPWSVRAAERGKHVLCEKPIALSARDAAELLAARDRAGVLIQEAFMVRSHPQWLGAVEIVESGRIGSVRAVIGAFSYFNEDAANIRNMADYGGGGLMDIGCYLINTARLVLGREPQRVAGAIDRDRRFGTDRLASMILDFGSAHAVGTCSTQMIPYQRVQILGTSGRVEIEIPFNPPNDCPCRLFVDGETIETEICDQYALQADLFSQAIRAGMPAPYPLEDSVRNMAVIEAVGRSAELGTWEVPETLPVGSAPTRASGPTPLS